MNLQMLVWVFSGVILPTQAWLAASMNHIGIGYQVLIVLAASTGGIGWVCLMYKLGTALNDKRNLNTDFLNKYSFIDGLLLFGEFVLFVLISPLLSGIIGFKAVDLIIKAFV